MKKNAGLKECSTDKDSQKPASHHTFLIVYFSKTGNTKRIAEYIHHQINGDIIAIETIDPYPDNYDKIVDQAKQEQEDGYRPLLITKIEHMVQYDTIFLGFPIWWGTFPMVVATFLEEYDFSGKTIIPFATHGGSQLGSSVSDIAKLCPDSILLEGLAISEDDLDSGESQVQSWLQKLKMAN